MLVGYSKNLIQESKFYIERIPTNKFCKGYHSFPSGFIYFMADNSETLWILMSDAIKIFATGTHGDDIHRIWTESINKQKRKKAILLEVRKINAELEFNKFFPLKHQISKSEIVKLKQHRKNLEEEKILCYRDSTEFTDFKHDFINWIRAQVKQQ